MEKVQNSDYYKLFILHIAALDILSCISVYHSTEHCTGTIYILSFFSVPQY